jgi:hypothetical protein
LSNELTEFFKNIESSKSLIIEYVPNYYFENTNARAMFFKAIVPEKNKLKLYNDTER